MNAYTNEKVYILKDGIEFGEYAGKCILISKALYGFCSIGERLHTHLADTLHPFVFFRLVSIMTFGLDLTNLETTTNISAHVLMTLLFSRIIMIDL